jgi:hypothetical protein
MLTEYVVQFWCRGAVARELYISLPLYCDTDKERNHILGQEMLLYITVYELNVY